MRIHSGIGSQGHSHAAYVPYVGCTSRLWAGLVGPGAGATTKINEPISGAASPFGATDLVGLWVDPTMGTLKFEWGSSVAINTPIRIVLDAWFGNHRY